MWSRAVFSNDPCPIFERSEPVTPEACVETVRSANPLPAEPIRPGENLAVWMERAARRCGVEAGRLKAYWHRKVARPAAHEYIAILAAANDELRRRAAIESLETEIAARTASLRADHVGLVSDHPVLARLVPRPAAQAEAESDAQEVDRRAAGRPWATGQIGPDTIRFYSAAARLEGEERRARRAGGR